MEALRAHTEEHLISRVRDGDAIAFEELFERHRGEVHSVCHRVLGPTEAEDATQQTFLAAYLAIARRGKRPERLRRWLRTIAHNESVSHLRRRRVSAPIPDEMEDGGSAADEALQRSEIRGMVDDLLRLPEDQRIALVLAELDERSHREIAAYLECRPAKVKALIFQARTNLTGLREAREVPCAHVRAQLTRARVGRPPGKLTRHLETCPSCATFVREARRERRGALALLPFGAVLEWARSLLGDGGAGAHAAAAAGSAGGGAALQGGLAKVGILVLVGGAAASPGLGRGPGEVGPPERASAAPSDTALSAPSPSSAGGALWKHDDSGTRNALATRISSGPEPDRAGRHGANTGGPDHADVNGGGPQEPASGAGPAAGGTAAGTPAPPDSGTEPQGPPPTQGKPAGPPPQAATGGPPADSSATTANGPNGLGTKPPAVPPVKPSPACPLPAQAHAPVC